MADETEAPPAPKPTNPEAKKRPNPNNPNAPNKPKRVRAADRKRKALDYRIGGLTFQEIGQNLGISHVSARDLVNSALEGLRVDIETSAVRLREIETARLDAVQSAIWGSVLKGDLGAVDRFVKISARRAAMWGMDVQQLPPYAGQALGDLIPHLPPEFKARIVKGESLDIVVRDWALSMAQQTREIKE